MKIAHAGVAALRSSHSAAYRGPRRAVGVVDGFLEKDAPRLYLPAIGATVGGFVGGLPGAFLGGLVGSVVQGVR